MCVGPLMAGYLYVSIGFFWLCTVLSALFLTFIPFAYVFIGGDRQLIRRRTGLVESQQQDIVVIVVPDDDKSSISTNTVTVTNDKQKQQET